MRSTHARELNKGWDVDHGEKAGRMTNYYAQVLTMLFSVVSLASIFRLRMTEHWGLGVLNLAPTVILTLTDVTFQSKVCRSCFLVYRTLDKAREAVVVGNAGRPPSQFRSRQELSKSVPVSYKQQVEEKAQKELLKVSMMRCVCVEVAR